MAKYLTKFDSMAEYSAATDTLDYPNISYIEGSGLVWEETEPYVPTNPYETQYLTFVAREDGTFKFSGNPISYSTDSGETWEDFNEYDSITIASGETVMWKGEIEPNENGGSGTFSSTGQFDVQGNPMSLLYGDDFIGQIDLTGKDYAFAYLFSGCTTIVNAENLVLPATTLATWCYWYMFNECTSLTTPPSLPATTLAERCYGYMFLNCASLATAPELPATTLANHCYQGMFYGCESLTTAPELPATTLAYYCYSRMFRICTSLTTAPELLATTLAPYCYERMFGGSTNLNYVKCLATDISANNPTLYWLNDVAETGTFVKAAGMNDWGSGSDGIPENWTVQDYVE